MPPSTTSPSDKSSHCGDRPLPHNTRPVLANPACVPESTQSTNRPTENQRPNTRSSLSTLPERLAPGYSTRQSSTGQPRSRGHRRFSDTQPSNAHPSNGPPINRQLSNAETSNTLRPTRSSRSLSGSIDMDTALRSMIGFGTSGRATPSARHPNETGTHAAYPHPQRDGAIKTLGYILDGQVGIAQAANPQVTRNQDQENVPKQENEEDEEDAGREHQGSAGEAMDVDEGSVALQGNAAPSFTGTDFRQENYFAGLRRRGGGRSEDAIESADAEMEDEEKGRENGDEEKEKKGTRKRKHS